VCQSRVFVAPKFSLKDATVGSSIEYGSPRFELAHPCRRFLRVQLRHSPVIQILAATHGIGEVNLPVVAIVDVAERGGDPALRHHGVGFAEQRFADETD
jgi:hypothetical protein